MMHHTRASLDLCLEYSHDPIYRRIFTIEIARNRQRISYGYIRQRIMRWHFPEK